jgi:hypothetical protein
MPLLATQQQEDAKAQSTYGVAGKGIISKGFFSCILVVNLSKEWKIY